MAVSRRGALALVALVAIGIVAIAYSTSSTGRSDAESASLNLAAHRLPCAPLEVVLAPMTMRGQPAVDLSEALEDLRTQIARRPLVLSVAPEEPSLRARLRDALRSKRAEMRVPVLTAEACNQ